MSSENVSRGLKYRVDGSVAVTPAIAPVQHDWSPLYDSIENAKRREDAKKAEETRAQAAKAKQAADEAKYNPDNVNDVDYNDAIHQKGMEVLRYSAKSYANGTTGSPEHNYTIGKLQNETGLLVGKSKAAISQATQSYQNVDQLPKYVDKNKLNDQIYNLAHPKGDNGKINFEAIDPKAIANVPADYYHAINTADMYTDKGKDLGEKIQKGEIQFPVADPNDPNALNNVVKSDMYQAKFFKPVTDKYGKISYVPGVTDQTAQFFLNNDPEILGEAKVRLQDYIQAETAHRVHILREQGYNPDIRLAHNDVEKGLNAGQFMLNHVKSNLDRINASTHQTENKVTKVANPGAGKDDKVVLGKPVESNINGNLGEQKDNHVATGYIPFEQTISSKGEGKVKPLTVNTQDLINIDNNTKEKPVGNQAFHPRAILKVPMQKVNGKDQVYLNSKEKVLSNKNVYYEYFIDGQVEYDHEGDDGKVQHLKKSALVPLKNVHNELVERGVNVEDYIPKASDPYGIK